jgi:hypothetical protein
MEMEFHIHRRLLLILIKNIRIKEPQSKEALELKQINQLKIHTELVIQMLRQFNKENK